MISLSDKIDDFIALGDYMRKFSVENNYQKEEPARFEETIRNVYLENAWFTEDNVRKSISAHGSWLTNENLKKWLEPYKINEEGKPRRIGVVAAGNIPLVGFHDFISVIFSGHIFIGKLSSKDNKLMQHIADFLFDRNAAYKELIIFEEKHLKKFDAVIATGSDNTSRYFEFYFGKYPHIIRRNRNSIAILNGEEKKENFVKLGNDIFDYFGLGCRNISKIFIPEKFDFANFFESINDFSFVSQHNKYANNYDYNRSIYLMNQIQHYDNGFVLLKEDPNINSPIGVIHYQTYNNITQVQDFITQNRDSIQCIVGNDPNIEGIIDFGEAQKPGLWDYADNVDTMEFLINIT